MPRSGAATIESIGPPTEADRARATSQAPAEDEAGVGSTPVKRTVAKKASPAKKAAPAKKTAPAKKAPAKRIPAKKTAPQPPVAAAAGPGSATASGVGPPPTAAAQATTEVPPGAPLRVVSVEPDRQRFDSIGAQLLAEPARAPEILAGALVRVLGPRARGWADEVRAAYPTASREALSRLAVQQFTRAAGLRGGFGVLAGPYAPVALGAITVITHAELVLHLAAIHGLDPADPQRAGDLLRLVSPGFGTVAGWAALAFAGPGGRLLAAFLSARTMTEAVAVRACRFYTDSQVSQESGRS